MGNYTFFLKFENPRRGRQARNLSENDPKILDHKSSSEQIIFRKLSLGAPVKYPTPSQIFEQEQSGTKKRLLAVFLLSDTKQIDGSISKYSFLIMFIYV